MDIIDLFLIWFMGYGLTFLATLVFMFIQRKGQSFSLVTYIGMIAFWPLTWAFISGMLLYMAYDKIKG